MKKKKIVLICGAAAVLLAAIITAALSHEKKDNTASKLDILLDTVCKVTLYEWNGNSDDILYGAFDLCQNYELLFSTTISSSDIYRINHGGGKPVTVDPATIELISDALGYCELSGGAFDITILPVKNMWDFSGNSTVIPDKNKLSEAVELVDYTKIKIEGNSIILPDGMGIDPGGIAKGYIADKMAKYLRERGVSSAVIDLGGNIYAIGSSSDGSKWKIGIKMPFKDGQADIVEVSDCSVVTSGVYQRYFTGENGEIYHHILDPNTGNPCDSGLYSATIISDSSERSDALSTICMLLGYERSAELLSKFPDVKAVLITSDYQVLYINK